MSTATNFVIVTLPRSGSYHLVSLLDSASDVVCHGEVLKANYIELRQFYLDKLKLNKSDVATRDQDRLGFVQRLRAVNRFKNVGFKIFPDHVNRDQDFVDGLMNNPAWRKLFLFRSPLQTYASLLRAKKTGVWVLTEGAPYPTDQLHAKVDFTVESFEQHLGMCRWFEGICERTERVPKNRTFRTDYARLADDVHMQQILQFVGSKVSVSDLVSDKQRQYSAPFEEGFNNWPEFRQYLMDHDMADLLLGITTVTG